MKRQPTTQLTARVPPEMIRALDDLAARRMKLRGTPVDRADVIREALHTILEDDATGIDANPDVQRLRAEARAHRALRLRREEEVARDEARREEERREKLRAEEREAALNAELRQDHRGEIKRPVHVARANTSTPTPRTTPRRKAPAHTR